MSSSEAIRVLPVDRWATPGPPPPTGLDTEYCSIALCDPFDGLPIMGYDFGRSPDQPPPTLRFAPELQPGYDFWRRTAPGRLAVRVCLAEPDRANGLDDPQSFAEKVDEVDAIIHTTERSICSWGRSISVPDSCYRQDNIAPHPWFDTPLRNAITAANEAGPPLLTCDLDLAPVPARIAAALNLAREQVGVLAWGQEDMSDPDGELLASDMVYCDTLQWVHIGRMGKWLAEVDRKAGPDEAPESVMIVAPPEFADMARKIQVLGGQEQYVDAYCPRPEIANQFSPFAETFYGRYKNALTYGYFFVKM